MSELESTRSDRIAALEQSLRRLTIANVGLLLVIAVLVAVPLASRRPGPGVLDVVRTRRLEVLDDKGVMRVRIGQDPADSDRRSRAAGILIFDATGAERGGYTTLDDASVVLALDAPEGVGSPMRERIGMMIYPDGSSHINLLNNETLAVARLFSNADGRSGVQTLKLDPPNKQVLIRTLNCDGDLSETKPMEE